MNTRIGQIVLGSILASFSVILTVACSSQSSETSTEETQNEVYSRDYFRETLPYLSSQELIGLNFSQVSVRVTPSAYRLTPEDDTIRNYGGVRFRVTNYDITRKLDPNFPEDRKFLTDIREVIAACVIYREDDDAYDIAVAAADASLYNADTLKKAREGFYLPVLEERTKNLTSTGVGCQGWGPVVPLSQIVSPKDSSENPQSP